MILLCYVLDNLMKESNDFLNNNNRTVAESDSGRNRNNYRQWRKDKKWMNKWNKNATILCSSLEAEELEGAVDDEKMPCRRRHHHHHHRRHHHHHHRTFNIKCYYIIFILNLTLLINRTPASP